MRINLSTAEKMVKGWDEYRDVRLLFNQLIFSITGREEANESAFNFRWDRRSLFLAPSMRRFIYHIINISDRPMSMPGWLHSWKYGLSGPDDTVDTNKICFWLFVISRTGVSDEPQDIGGIHFFRLASQAVIAYYFQETFGNPWLITTFDPAWLRWSNGTVKSIVLNILKKDDYGLMPILADSLEDAGCQDETIIEHLRSNDITLLPEKRKDPWLRGPLTFADNRAVGVTNEITYNYTYTPTHYRGCWVLHGLLGGINPWKLEGQL